ncbi:MAG: hypothetical protein HY735_08220 [Verrucomicrobia bacterium]|nr:hypothetical protein [Verrucomicrobiota bacterium]
MSEINLNSLGGPAETPRSPTKAAANQKNQTANGSPSGTDSVEFSKLPDFAQVEQAVEDGYASQRSSLQEDVDSASYPPLVLIEKVAAMLAAEFQRDRNDS